MTVIRASVLGYCMGVRRAVTIAYEESKAGRSRRVYTLGPLIHNPHVLEDLRARNVEALEETELPKNLRDTTVIIRAHGITPALEAELVRRGARLLDATCPNVKASQMKAASLSEAGYRIFLAGEKQHGEIIGIRGYAQGCLMAADPQEAEKTAARLCKEAPDAKTALLGQTTMSPEEYRLLSVRIQNYFPDLEIIDAVCGATKNRQEALKELCAKTDALVVVGGRESANTRRLLAIARDRGKPAWLVESAGDIPVEAGSYPVVGLSAGASTPDDLIDKIERELYNL
ncbi:MAG: 4-hydroxy-3-methylbut-2-enyl diphosphate reductase [Treponema sp.]|nr:4-hydroxy-3-methylbut-2-enyl diphosphate reductase [Treponema sp.]